MAGSKRERDLHQAKVARQAAEAAEARDRRKRRLQIGGAIVGVIAVIALVAGVAVATNSPNDSAGDPIDFSGTTTTSKRPTAPADLVTCTAPTGKAPKTLSYKGNNNTLIKGGKYTETMTTNCGEIVFTMDAEKAPKTTAAVAFLSDRDGYYNNTKCHRLVTAGIYVLQCGDPKGDGTGGPGFTLPEENLPKAGKDGMATYKRGWVAMANTGQKHSTGSQFFLIYKDSPLEPKYTVLGEITKGLEIVDHVAAQGTIDGSTDGPPKQPLEITKMVSSVTYAAG